jgi:predicted helicase
LEEEYLAWWRIADISEGISGIETKRDHFAIDQDRSVLQQRITDFVDGAYTDAARKMKFDLRDNEWVVADAVKHLRKDRSWEKRFVQCLYRPFDPVWIIYHGTILSRDRGELMYGMTKNNLGLVAARQSKEPFAVLATNCVCTHKIVTVYDRSFLFPLYRYPSETGSASRLAGFNERSVNLSFGFIEKVCSIVQLKWTADETGDLKRTIGPEDVFHYAYALFYSPSYRSRYAEFLKIDFPRLPLTANLELFRALIALGGELTALHLLQSPRLNQPITEFIGGRHSEVEKISWSRDTVWIDTAKTTGFRGVREEIWNFHIGGYQVCEKWLKDRKGCSLSKGDLTHYQKTVVALSETIRLMNKIDEVIEAHGGWPGAFSSKP